MKDEVKQFLNDYCLKNEWGICETPDEFAELLTGSTKVHKEIGATHRWYNDTFNVVEIDGKLIGFDWFHITGDNSVRDMGLELDMDSVCFVEKKQRVTDYYEAI